MKNTLTFIILCFLTTLAFAASIQQLDCYHVPKQATLNLIGPLPPQKRLHLAIELPGRNKAQRDQLLVDLYDPKSPDYRHYLTPQEYTQRFGAIQADYDAVAAFFKAQGFIVTRSSNRLLLDLDGTVKVIEATFHTSIFLYKHPTENRTFYAPDKNPSVDLDIPLSGVVGLDNFSRIRPLRRNSTGRGQSPGTQGDSPL